MEKQLIENANEAFQTAKLTSYWLMLAGLPEAVEYGKMIGLDREIDPSVIPYSEKMCFLNPIIHEIRYTSINYYIRKSGCRNVLDIACGYSPRGMLLAREGFHYVGADLPAVVDDLRDAVAGLGLEYLTYRAVDATNFESLLDAIKPLDGPVCVVVEGLSMYLNRMEAKTVRDNIARLIREREGSCYITTDPGNGYLFNEVINATQPQRLVLPTFGMLFTMYNWASNGGITTETEKRPLEEDVRMFEESGFHVDVCPLRPDAPELLTYRGLKEEEKDALRGSLKKPLVFVSGIENAEWSDAETSPEDCNEDKFSIYFTIKDDLLLIRLSGRLDTLTVPELLQCFEDHTGEAEKGVIIDLTGVTFISSAGTRAIYLMRKELGEGKKLEVSGASDSVQQVIDHDGVLQHL